MIIDVVTYNGEKDLFDIRYNVLKDYVDEFIVVECPSTFSNSPKPLYFEEIRDKYEKVKYYVNDEDYTQEEIDYARSSPNTGGVPRWINEFLQKESIKNALTHLNDDDMVFVGDVDEIWEPRLINDYTRLRKLKLRVYTYYLNLHSSEQFWGTVQCRYKDIKNECLNHIRNGTPEKNTLDYCGWHFTNQGGIEAVRQKLFDQYNPEEFGDQTYNSLPVTFGVKDYIGRDFTFKVEEIDLPKYILDNREKYEHLFKKD